MKNGKCPKCGSDDVRLHESALSQDSFLKLGPFSFAHVVNYICPECGFLESYVRQDSLEKLKEKLPRARTQMSKTH